MPMSRTPGYNIGCIERQQTHDVPCAQSIGHISKDTRAADGHVHAHNLEPFRTARGVPANRMTITTTTTVVVEQ